MSEQLPDLLPSSALAWFVVGFGVLVMFAALLFWKASPTSDLKLFAIGGRTYVVVTLVGLAFIGWGGASLVDLHARADEPKEQQRAGARPAVGSSSASAGAGGSDATSVQARVATVTEEKGALVRAEPRYSKTGNTVGSIATDTQIEVVCRTRGPGKDRPVIDWLRIDAAGKVPEGFVAADLTDTQGASTQPRWCWSGRLIDGAQVRSKPRYVKNGNTVGSVDANAQVVIRCSRDGPGKDHPIIRWLLVERSRSVPQGFVSTGLVKMAKVVPEEPPVCANAKAVP